MEKNQPKKTHYLRTFGLALLVAWVIVVPLYLYIFPIEIYGLYYTGLTKTGVGGVPIPVNMLYTMPAQYFISPYAAQNNLLVTGVNHDTLYTFGWLQVNNGPLILHVPDMAGRYYSVEFCNPLTGTVFTDVGTRTTGTNAGDFLITAPGWQGTVPAGVTQISSPGQSVLVIGRTLVESDSDLATVYALASQIQVTPLSQWKPG